MPLRLRPLRLGPRGVTRRPRRPRRRLVDARLRDRRRPVPPPTGERSDAENQALTRRLYDGPAGAVLALASAVSLHEPLIGSLLRRGKFDVSRFDSILDVGSGAGQILTHLLRECRPDARVTAFDLSHNMLRRARRRLDSKPAHRAADRNDAAFVSGDLMHLPFADASFDCVTAGWVLEHLNDPAPGLREIARVLRPGGRVLLLCTEDNVTGSLNSRTWKCRTLNRGELRSACEAAGLPWEEELFLTPIHKALKFGGIVVEAVRAGDGFAGKAR